MLIRTNKATAQKDILTYARILVEVSIDQDFPTEIVYVNEKGMLQSQLVQYERKLIICADCKGIGHTKEECTQKRYEVAKRKL